MTVEDFLEIRSNLTVKEHVQGQIVLKFPVSLLQHPAVAELSNMEKSAEAKEIFKKIGFISAKPNLLFSTLILNYDVERVSPQILHSFFTGGNITQVLEQAQQIATLLGIEFKRKQGGH